MKKCVPRILDRAITVLAAAVCAGISFLLFRELLRGGQSPIVGLSLGVLFGGAAIRIIWRVIHMGGWGIFYDEERIIFVLSRKERREFRWDELQSPQIHISYISSPASWHFYFPGMMRVKEIAATPRMAGWEEFTAMLGKKAVPAQEVKGGSVPFDKKAAREIYHEIFGENHHTEGRRKR